jgi:lariat debranching enzyme
MQLNIFIILLNFIMESSSKTKVRIAVVGCLHGMLSTVYETVMNYEKTNNKIIDLVLICGDFESIRNTKDLDFIHVPDKYRKMGDFSKFYSKKEKAPYLTIFIGGNHEASNFLDEMFNGGYACDNIFYLGRTGVVNYKGLRIGGISGIYKANDYNKGHFEKCFKMKNDHKISIYHQREYDIAKLNLLSRPVDIMLSHDWPHDIVNKNDVEKILSYKKGWDDLADGELGSRSLRYLLNTLKPKYWFSAHMHYYYKNILTHKNKETTTFIALDKIVDKKRQWLDIIECEVNTDQYINNQNIQFDTEWLGICKEMNTYFPDKESLYSFACFMKDKNEYKKVEETKSSKKVFTSANFINNVQENIKYYDDIFKLDPQLLDIKYTENTNDYHKYIATYYKDKVKQIDKNQEGIYSNINFSAFNPTTNTIDIVSFSNNDEEINIDY